MSLLRLEYLETATDPSITSSKKNLVDMNTILQKESDKILTTITFQAIDSFSSTDCEALAILVTLLHNAPANLRYGPKDDLNELLDPMGNSLGVLTTDENN